MRYTDRHGRVQVGEVYGIEASWSVWNEADEPLIVYAVRHPTYAKRRFYAVDENIHGYSND